MNRIFIAARNADASFFFGGGIEELLFCFFGIIFFYIGKAYLRDFLSFAAELHLNYSRLIYLRAIPPSGVFYNYNFFEVSYNRIAHCFCFYLCGAMQNDAI